MIQEINLLLEQEKYEKAKQLLEDKLHSPRATDQLISKSQPDLPRLVRLSQDRNLIVWSEDDRLIYRDLANPLVKNIKLPGRPSDLQISSDGKYAIVSIKLQKLKGCRQLVYSWNDTSYEFESGAHISCKNSNAITNDGKILYYFIDDHLYSEETKLPKKPTPRFSVDDFPSPYPKIKNRYILVPIQEEFLLFSGNGGSYNMYWFQPKKNKIDLVSKNIFSPRVYLSDEKSLYLISGTIGNLFLKEVRFVPGKIPTVDNGIPISQGEVVSWKLQDRLEFLSQSGNSVFKWGPGKSRQYYPIFVERFWGVAREMIVYENQNGELYLADTAYSEEDWTIWNLYKTAKKKLEE